jgi:TPP-dependent pyruvate/acetoin dehydrogenase alpha subunit
LKQSHTAILDTPKATEIYIAPRKKLTTGRKTAIPLCVLQSICSNPKLLDEGKAEEIDKQAEQVIVKAVEFAEESPEPDISTLTEYVYA